jgi:asparaginyl-tRNA synthetase
MVEPEMAFYDLEDDMNLAEDFLRYLFKDVLEHCLEDLEFFNQQIDKTLLKRHQVVIDNQFERVSYSKAIELLGESNKAFNYSVEWGNNLQSEHERYISEEVFEKPVIIYDYPEEIKPFYMKANSDGKTVRAMDVLLPKLGEIIGGSQREEDYNVLLNRMKIKNLNPDDYKWYLDLRRFGSAPHAGFGLGFERLVQFVTGMENIRDVIPFPRTPKNARF